MRIIGFGLSLILATTLAACGGGSGTGDDAPPTDGGGGADSDLPPPARGFQVVSADVVIEPGQEITYCYYFRTPNTEPMAINRWSSSMTPGSHHMIMFTTGTTDVMPPGTITATGCEGFGGGNINNPPSWTYAAQTPTADLQLPADDGAGKPLAQLIAPNTAAYFQMHYLNPSDSPMTVHVTVNAEALAAGAAYTPTASFISYNNVISIPANTNGVVQSKTCTTPATSKFWLLSTHAHKQAVKTVIKNGLVASTDIAYESTDWEHPGAEAFMTDPFYTFTGDRLTFECTYNNPTNREIKSGGSAETDEMCMATGYFFPATQPVFCLCVSSAQNCINF